MNNSIKKSTYFIYFNLIVLTCFSFVFTNIGYDSEYQLAMAYRMVQGDSLITQMWEPHQTSAFLCAILMELYIGITGTTTGIVLFTQFAGLFIRTGISIFLFKTVKEISGEIPALIAGLIFFLISPKDLLTPEFSNMQLWFGMLVLLTLTRYLSKKNLLSLILSAICLCLGVFAYPSFIITYAAIVVILYRYSEQKARDITVFTGMCACVGGAFVGYLMLRMDLDTMLFCLDKALSLEPTHTVSMFQKLLDHFKNLAQICGILALICGIGFLITCITNFIYSKRNHSRESFSYTKWLIISWYVLQFIFLLNILSAENRGGYGIPLFCIMVFGFAKRKLLSKQDSALYNSALCIGTMSLISTLVLSDHAFLLAIPYMLVTVCISVLPLYRWFETLKTKKHLAQMFTAAVHLFLLLNIFRALFIHIPMHGRGQICSVLDDLALIRNGPAIGIITDEEGAARQRDSMGEWKQYVKAGNTIWLLGEPVDTLGYLYEDVEVGAPTVMSTPTYNSNLLYYWELNPDKYPDVVILSSSFGELSWDLLKNEWLLEWLETEYCADQVIDGNYWRYYIKD